MKILGLARIGNEPELRYTSSSMATLQLSLAYNWGREKKTQWVRGTLFGKRAESLAPHLVKGQLLYVEISDLHIEQFETKDGKQGVVLQGILQELEFTAKAEAAEPKQEPKQAKQEPLPTQSTSLGDMEDDCPF